VVAPSTPNDAKGLLKASIRDLNPVIYCEHKYLYRHAKGDVPSEENVLPLGQADVKREGNDITLITYGAMVQQGLEAADQMSGQGIEVELVDLRTLYPYDTTTILASVKKTGKVLIVHEAPQVCGIGAEIAAMIAQEAFPDLDAPVTRLTAPHTPVPFSPPLEDFYLPNAAKIAAKLKDLASY
jgi:2-oxoisovalerate dehydrogenase E1 component beta subunit